MGWSQLLVCIGTNTRIGANEVMDEEDASGGVGALGWIIAAKTAGI